MSACLTTLSTLNVISVIGRRIGMDSRGHRQGIGHALDWQTFTAEAPMQCTVVAMLRKSAKMVSMDLVNFTASLKDSVADSLWFGGSH